MSEINDEIGISGLIRETNLSVGFPSSNLIAAISITLSVFGSKPVVSKSKAINVLRFRSARRELRSINHYKLKSNTFILFSVVVDIHFKRRAHKSMTKIMIKPKSPEQDN